MKPVASNTPFPSPSTELASTCDTSNVLLILEQGFTSAYSEDNFQPFVGQRELLGLVPGKDRAGKCSAGH